jgi:hypothetical protein
MSILSKRTIKKYSNRKITKNFLKKHGFYVDRWGGPHDREKETSVFYEAQYADGIGIVGKNVDVYSIQATIKYFPEEFDRYTNFNTNHYYREDQNGTGFGIVAGKLVITYEDAYWSDKVMGEGIYKDTMIFDCKTHADFYYAIDCFNIDLIEKDYTPITF